MARVLLIEDRAPLRALMATVLADAGHRVEAVATTAEGVAHLAAAGYDVVITDWYGAERLRELRAAAREAPILLITGRSDAARAGTDALGVAAILRKPFGTAELQR